ncbi:MAG TPA: GNAT family N-acetyltransferase [Polyangia bacterium]|jgi:ribosomal protein S18 acetylase RimI-like enzyme|nr:GNAT family N-acetyltransferase [Polyangia bacterium]
MPGGLRFSRPTPALARAQARWIAAIEPWRGLGYQAAALGRYLARKARARAVWVVRRQPRGAPLGVAVVDDGVLLGGFIALLAVRPEASGQGLGRALVGQVAARTFEARRWLYVSTDGKNGAALRFYRKLGFSRVGRLPDLVRRGRVEILLRKPAPSGITKIPARTPRVGYHGEAS